jgi:hypothetical protein
LYFLAISMLASGFWLCRPNRPQCCWLVFGPGASVRILVRLDGAVVALERHEHGRPAQEVARFDRLEDCKDVVIEGTDETTTYHLLSVTDLKAAPAARLLEFVVSIHTPASDHQQAGWLWMAVNREKASVAHFDGPLTVSAVDKNIGNPVVRWDIPANLVLRRGEKPTEMFVNVGTTNARDSCRVTVCTVNGQTNQRRFPKEVHPCADIEFPPNEPTRPPIRKRYALASVC